MAVLGAGASAAILWDDLGYGSRWFRRTALPGQPTWQVATQAGDPEASRTVVFVAHHDAAHSGLVFHPALGRIGPRIAPRHHERALHTSNCVRGLAGPRRDLYRRSARQPAAGVGGAHARARCDRGDDRHRPAFGGPGANDNLGAVGAPLAYARSYCVIQRSELSYMRLWARDGGSGASPARATPS